MKTIKLLHVQYLPKDLDEGVLYVSKEFEVAGHLCPCGCKNKIITPIGKTEWSYSERKGKPSLYPSLGNWQLPCRSHYWITKGVIEWSYQWSDQQIKAGAEAEAKQKENYYKDAMTKHKKKSLFSSFLRLFGR